MLLGQDANALFCLFRYQILPINRNLTDGLFQGSSDVSALLARKNDYFSEALLSAQRLISRGVRVEHSLVHQVGDFYLFKMAANRHLRRETRDFKKEDLDNWPAVYVAIWNDPDRQIIAVQQRVTAFAAAMTPAKIIEGTANVHLEKWGLRAHVEPLFEERAFWQLVNEYGSRIKRLTFELVTPNMSNISASLDDDLKNLAKSTNTAKTKLTLEPDQAAVLNVDSNNPGLTSLVDYASKGGGDVTLKIRGVKKTMRAQKDIRQIEVDSIIMNGAPEAVVDMLKEILTTE
ncbi:hypothetical protein [Dyella terrae]|uniref:hypothetical protein n=1 Tax=Dyella terrae TaxID=522259 RepID=UPI001EFE0F46|nr:hypothetical protein [Dyella terrae]ULU23536.1 hypothetical protein DYST_00434 [Dyella terrae]